MQLNLEILQVRAEQIIKLVSAWTQSPQFYA